MFLPETVCNSFRFSVSSVLPPCGSVVVAAGEDFLARGPEDEGVLILGHVRTLDVAQWWVGIDQPHIAQVLERKAIGLTERETS